MLTQSEGKAVAVSTGLSLRVIAPVMVLGLLLETVAHALGTWGPEANVGLAALLMTAATALYWRWRPPSVENVHSGIAFLVCIMVAVSLAHVAVQSPPGANFFLAFGIVATGGFVMSRAWLIPMLAVQLFAWFAITGVSGQLVAMPLTTVLLAVAIHAARRKSVQAAHQRQVALEAANARLRVTQDALDSAGDPVLWLKDDGKITYANEAATRLLGYDSSELLSLQIDAIDLGLTPHSSDAHETSYRGKDGTVHPVEVRSRRIAVANQPFDCVIARDLSERRRMEDKLRVAQRMESLGVLAGGLAHDFNNLLVGITGNASLAKAELDAGSPAQAHLDELLEASDRAALLTSQLLAYSGGAATETQRLDLSDEVRGIVHLLESSLPKGVALNLDLCEDLPAVVADRAQLQQVVMNLVVNAGEALEGGGSEVRIRTRTQTLTTQQASELEPTLSRPAGCYVCFEVSDDGCGMDAATQARVFDPFFTTKSHGRGLGLSAALGIVRHHGGGFAIRSDVRRGSTVGVLLPAAEAGPTRVEQPEEIPSREANLILVVDDEPMVRGVARASLENAGFAVIEAQDGVQAVEVAREHKNEIGLILLDLTMPRMSGREALPLLHEIQPGVPVVLSSGYEASSEAAQGDSPTAGATTFLSKPYRPADLVRIVREHLDHGAISGDES